VTCDDGLTIEGSSLENHAYFLAYSFPQLMCLDSYIVTSRRLHHLEPLFTSVSKATRRNYSPRQAGSAGCLGDAF